MTRTSDLGLNAGDYLDWALIDGSAGSVANSGVLSAPPVFNVTQIANQLRTQWGGAQEGTYRAWFGSTVTYSIADYYPTNAAYGESDAYVMSPVMKDVARLGFELWDDAIAINLTESVNDPAANVTMNWANLTYNGSGVLSTGGGTYARATLGGQSGGYTQITAQQIWLNMNWSTHDQDSDMFYGSYGVITFIHEIGHTLGLSHPGTYNAGNNPVTYANNAEFAQDNREYTIMSYFGGYNPNTNSWAQDGTSGSWYYPSTPMVYDIAAIQATYGADYTTRAGNSTYGFNITADVAAREANGLAVYSFAQNAHPIFTIWDGSGNDTLDCSGYAANQTIDLIAGDYSSIGGMNGNIGIAYGCTIENAVGGSGFDTITGNSADNILRGNGGNDTINGGGGTDSAVFAGVRASYTLTDLGGGSVRVTGPDGTDTLTSVELLVFNDQTVSLVNHAPQVSLPSGANVNASTAGQVFQMSSLFAGSDADGDALTYFLYDSSPAAGSGHIMIGGVSIPAETIYGVSAAQFAQATFVTGSAGTSDALYVETFDGQAYSGWNAYVHVAAPINHAPTVSLPSGPSVTTSSGGVALPFSSLFTGSDADNNPLSYFVYDGSPAANSGHFVVNGTVVPAETIYQISAAQLAQTTFVTGAPGTADELYVETFDGQAYSGWNASVHVAVRNNTAPTINLPSGSAVHANAGQSLAASGLFSGSDANGDALSYFIYDGNPAGNSGHFAINGATVPAEIITPVTAAQLAQTVFQAGAAGTTDYLYVEAYDGQAYSPWTEFHVFV